MYQIKKNSGIMRMPEWKGRYINQPPDAPISLFADIRVQ